MTYAYNQIDGRGFVRYNVTDPTHDDRSDGSRGGTHCAGRGDVSPNYVTYPTGYDPACSWCWLGAPHSTAAHNERVKP